MADHDLVEAACEVMHDAYERAAVQEGWENQEQSRKPWNDVPEANKATMRAAVDALLTWLDEIGEPTPEQKTAEGLTQVVVDDFLVQRCGIPEEMLPGYRKIFSGEIKVSAGELAAISTSLGMSAPELLRRTRERS